MVRPAGVGAAEALGGSRAIGFWTVGAALIVYVMIFPLLYRLLGPVAPASSALIVVLGGALLGSRWGAISGLVCLPVNLFLLARAGDVTARAPAQAVGAVVIVAVGAAAGRLRELGVLLRRSHAALEEVLAEAREAHRTLAEREAQVAQAQALAHIGYWVLDLQTHAATWSTELCRIMGENPATARISEDAWWQHIHPEDRELLRRNAARGMVDGLPVQDEFRVVRADGKIRWVYGRAQTLRDESGKPVTLLGTVQDLTEHKELQAQLAAAERLATVGTLAAGVAHEINNPLSSVISNLEFLIEGLRSPSQPVPPRPPQELAAAAGEALQGANRVCRIVHDLMAFSRPHEQPGPVDVERVLDLSVNMAATQTRYRARVVKDYGRVPPANGDAWRLGQVFLNLLVNAAQAVPAGHPEEHEIRVSTRLAGDRIAISVRDNGMGMTPEVRRRIFEPFFTTRPVGAGMGLGLSTSLAVVRGLGGDIEVESEPGRGSVFTVTLPALAAPGAPAPAA
jgi:PAS domain S-box-containing protein